MLLCGRNLATSQRFAPGSIVAFITACTQHMTLWQFLAPVLSKVDITCLQAICSSFFIPVLPPETGSETLASKSSSLFVCCDPLVWQIFGPSSLNPSSDEMMAICQCELQSLFDVPCTKPLKKKIAWYCGIASYQSIIQFHTSHNSTILCPVDTRIMHPEVMDPHLTSQGDGHLLPGAPRSDEWKVFENSF